MSHLDEGVEIEEVEVVEKNSDMDILDTPVHQEIEMCEDDMLKQICYQILDKIEFERVPVAERDALLRLVMNRGLMELKEGRVTSPQNALLPRNFLLWFFCR